MAMHFSALSYSKEILMPAKYPKGGYLATSSLQHSFGYAERFHPRACSFWLAVPSVNHLRRRRQNLIANSATDGSGSDPSGSDTNNSTRLFRFFQTFQTKLRIKIEGLKKGLWIKVLFFLVGFYCATAFATVIGQTGDWDILSAGFTVVLVEVIGALMYQASESYFEKLRNLITIFNFWKAGLTLGLFLDAFKYEIDSFLQSCNPLKFEDDIFGIFWFAATRASACGSLQTTWRFVVLKSYGASRHMASTLQISSNEANVEIGTTVAAATSACASSLGCPTVL